VAKFNILLAGGVLFGLAIYLFNWGRRNATQRGHPLLMPSAQQKLAGIEASAGHLGYCAVSVDPNFVLRGGLSP
jgi:hypothetical protein